MINYKHNNKGTWITEYYSKKIFSATTVQYKEILNGTLVWIKISINYDYVLNS